MSGYDQYYEKYKEDYKQKYGEDYGHNYIGSAFTKRPDLRPEVDAEYLRDKMPNKEVPKKFKTIDMITEDCLRVMDLKAKDGMFKCTYRIKEIYPGLPLISNTRQILVELFRRVSARPGVTCYATGDDTLVITWARIRSE